MLEFEKWIFSDALDGLCRDQGTTFTSNHKKYNLTVKAKNKETHESREFHRTYQFAPNYTDFKPGDGVLAIINDAQAGLEDSAEDFKKKFGYDNTPEAATAWRECRRALRFLQSVGMTAEDIDYAMEALGS